MSEYRLREVDGDVRVCIECKQEKPLNNDLLCEECFVWQFAGATAAMLLEKDQFNGELLDLLSPDSLGIVDRLLRIAFQGGYQLGKASG